DRHSHGHRRPRPGRVDPVPGRERGDEPDGWGDRAGNRGGRGGNPRERDGLAHRDLAGDGGRSRRALGGGRGVLRDRPGGRGVRGRDVLTQYLVESLVMSLVGGVVGLATGAAGAEILANVMGWSTEISPATVVVAVGFSGAVGVFCGF